jgi:hypothetical protein
MNFLSVCDSDSVRHLRLTLNASVRHIPEWLPWFSYKPLARIGHNLGQEVLYEPIRFVKESIVSY